MVEACLCDEGTSCMTALEIRLSVTRFGIVIAIQSSCATKDRALLEGGEDCRAKLKNSDAVESMYE